MPKVCSDQKLRLIMNKDLLHTNMYQNAMKSHALFIDWRRATVLKSWGAWVRAVGGFLELKVRYVLRGLYFSIANICQVRSKKEVNYICPSGCRADHKSAPAADVP